MVGTEPVIARAPAEGRSHMAHVVIGQIRYANRQFWRSPLTAFFTLVLPLLFLVLVGLAAGNATLPGGVRVAQFYTPGLLAFAIATATFTTPAIAVSLARDAGVLKRLRATPLPAWAYLAGRMGSALFTALLSAAVMLVVAVVGFDVQLYWSTAPGAVLTLVVGIVTFGALAFALVALVDSTTQVQAIANGAVIALAFVSDVFIVSDTMPAWLQTFGGLFPLKHFAAALQDAFIPFASDASLWEHIAVMAAWATAGAVVAVLRFSWTPARPAATGVSAAVQTSAGPALDRQVHVDEPGRPGLAVLVWGQIRYANRTLWRDVGAVFFAIAFPILLLWLVPTVFGTGEVPWLDMTLPQWYAPAMAVYGVAVHAFVTMPEAVAGARDRGVLKRLRGSALPLRAYLLGRLLSVLLIAVLIVAATMAAGVLLYDIAAPASRIPAALVVVAVGTLSLAALGLAIAAVVPTAGAVPAVTLAALLPLSFVSDIFLLGDLPRAMVIVGWLFPLKHFVHALTAVFDGATPLGAAVAGHLLVMAGWGIAGAIVGALAFRWEPRVSRKRQPAAGRGDRGDNASVPPTGGDADMMRKV
jgi:ABC-2 type transport system permease protein